MNYQLLYALGIAFLLTACTETTENQSEATDSETTDNTSTESSENNTTTEAVDITDQVIGSWETEAMTGFINGLNGGTENDTVITNKDNFQEIFGISRLLAHYHADGTLQMEMRDSNDVVILMSDGTWSASGDTLIQIQGDPPVTSKSVLSFPDAETTIFSGIIDWDYDGEADDFVQGSSRRIPSE